MPPTDGSNNRVIGETTKGLVGPRGNPVHYCVDTNLITVLIKCSHSFVCVLQTESKVARQNRVLYFVMYF